MNATTTGVNQPKQAHANQSKRIMHLALGVLAAMIGAGALAGLNVGLGISDKTAFLALALVGFTMCAQGKLGEGAAYGWWNARHLAGYAIGAIALAMSAAVLAGWPLPYLANERQALLALTGLMVLKVVIAASYPRRA